MASIMSIRPRLDVLHGRDTPPQSSPRQPAESGSSLPPFGVSTHHLRSGHAWSWAKANDTGIGVLYGEGGGCTFAVTDDTACIWIPLRGALQIVTPYSSRLVAAGAAVVTDTTTPVRASAHAGSRWLAILGGHPAWYWLLSGSAAIDRRLLPEHYAASRNLRREAIAVVRAVDASGRQSAVRAVSGSIAGLQAPLYAAISRCPGRTYAQRRQVFVRLQRVRLFMASYCERELDNGLLARMASYSSHHFQHTFKCVYQETPHRYLVEQRLRRAMGLLRHSSLAITEIALACGFENPCAFSRLFHRRFGITAKAVRLAPVIDARRELQPDLRGSRHRWTLLQAGHRCEIPIGNG